MHSPLARFKIFALAAVMLLLAAANGRAESAVMQDVNGRTIVPSDSNRIVSIGGAITEILYALGVEDRVVAVDSTSLYPRQALADKKNVGYMRALSPEGVLGLSPSLIIAVEGSGPKETLEVLKSASVPLVFVPDPYSGEGIIEKVKMVSYAVDVPARGECLVKTVSADLSALATLEKKIEKSKRVMFVMSLLNGRAMVAGRKTAADGVIKLAGAVNVIDEFEGYKQITDEAIAAAKPDFVVTMQRGAESLTAEQLFAAPGFALAPAAENKAFAAVDGLYLLGFGPRTASAARDLVGMIYPELKTAADASGLNPVTTDKCRQ